MVEWSVAPGSREIARRCAVSILPGNSVTKSDSRASADSTRMPTCSIASGGKSFQQTLHRRVQQVVAEDTGVEHVRIREDDANRRAIVVVDWAHSNRPSSFCSWDSSSMPFVICSCSQARKASMDSTGMR